MTFLVALLLSGPLSARAEDTPASQGPEFDPADANADGTVSGKERRQNRRADRRARRAANGSTMSEKEADAADAAESAARTDAASSRAASAASALKNSLPSADAGGGIPPGGGGASATVDQTPSGSKSSTPGTSVAVSGKPSGVKPSGYSAGASGDPGRPQSHSDFALAAHSGYAPAFVAAGLKLGPDGRSVMRLDGKPTTQEDYARLQREISSMPAAIGRRSDFFSVVSPEHYADLKRGYKEKREGDPLYKDVGTTAGDRDFIHTVSCAKISGDCNKSIEQESYKKGDFVTPEALDDMWSALKKELDGSAPEKEGGGIPSLGGARSQIAREKALEAARALSGESTGTETTSVSATTISVMKDSTPVSQAVTSARRLWKNAMSVVLPGTHNGSEGTNPAWPIGAAALAAITAGVLFLRRKG